MNYNKLYTNIIEQAQKQSRQKRKDTYYENHHIIPKCLGGLKIKENMVFLTGKEHYICHHLLTKIYPNNDELRFAFWSMCNQSNSIQKRSYKITSIVYQNAKISFITVNSKLHKGKIMSENHILRSSKQWTENNPHKGKFGIDNTNSHQYEIFYNNNKSEIITGLQNFSKTRGYIRRSLYKVMNGEIKFHHDIISIIQRTT